VKAGVSMEIACSLNDKLLASSVSGF
jgi:hypothetical protein